jgi:hypothetical protein
MRAYVRVEPYLLVIACAILVLFMGARIARPAGQSTKPIQNPLNQRQQSPFDEPGADIDPGLAARQLKAMNAQRQKLMVSDAEKILKLAQEIHADVEAGQGRDGELTAMQARKIADIEKLAREVKQKMSTSLVGGPTFHDPVPLQIH